MPIDPITLGPTQRRAAVGSKPITDEELTKRFTYHAPILDQPERYAMIRSKARTFGEMLVDLTPASREQSLALTHLEEAVFWANAAIARNEGE